MGNERHAQGGNFYFSTRTITIARRKCLRNSNNMILVVKREPIIKHSGPSKAMPLRKKKTWKAHYYSPVDLIGVPLEGVFTGAVGESNGSCGKAVKFKVLGSDTGESF